MQPVAVSAFAAPAAAATIHNGVDLSSRTYRCLRMRSSTSPILKLRLSSSVPGRGARLTGEDGRQPEATPVRQKSVAREDGRAVLL